MRQGSLFDTEPVAGTIRDHIAACGEPWGGPHPLCDAMADALEAQFWRAVAAGTYDAHGYTPHERKAQRRKARA